jgi:DNA-binding CsgD family transcriptional regulator
MRRWSIPSAPAAADGALLARLIGRLGDSGFATGVLDDLRDAVPAASWSVYRAGPTATPTLFLSGSRGVPDTTRDCWRAYLTGPHRDDRTLRPWPDDVPDGVAGAARTSTGAAAGTAIVCHLTAEEVPREHRAKIYDSHGVSERVSVLDRQDDGAVFAVNFYRHRHQRPFSDAAIARVGDLAPALLALVRKQLAWASGGAGPDDARAARLQALCPGLTARERDVCLRLLRGMTQDGIACDLGLSLATVKTYRNRAFARLGIHFRNQLFARVLDA